MRECLTKQLMFKEASGCLVEKPECGYADKFGFSIVCRHPDHAKFHAHVAAALSISEIRELYDSLKKKRRDEFVSSLDDSGKKFFCYQTDFFGQSLTSMSQNESI